MWSDSILYTGGRYEADFTMQPFKLFYIELLINGSNYSVTPCINPRWLTLTPFQVSFQRAARTDKHVSAASNILSLKISTSWPGHIQYFTCTFSSLHDLRVFWDSLFSFQYWNWMHFDFLHICTYLKYYREETIRFNYHLFIFNYKLWLWCNLIQKVFLYVSLY